MQWAQLQTGAGALGGGRGRLHELARPDLSARLPLSAVVQPDPHRHLGSEPAGRWGKLSACFSGNAGSQVRPPPTVPGSHVGELVLVQDLAAPL